MNRLMPPARKSLCYQRIGGVVGSITGAIGGNVRNVVGIIRSCFTGIMMEDKFRVEGVLEVFMVT